MPEHFVDRLTAAIAEKRAPVCVGVDPLYERLPEALAAEADGPQARLEAMRQFCQGVIEEVAPHVPAVKVQSAYFEAYGADGVALYEHVVGYARHQGLIVIGDVKRNDIGSTAGAYARGHLAGRPGSGSDAGVADAVTVNPYFGIDGIQPFLDVAAETGRGVFALVRTSNPSAAEVQDLADAGGQKVYQHVADRLAEWGDGEGLCGQSGWSLLGAVVGATWPAEAAELRKRMPRQVFLVPGYGAQGASAADCAAAFEAGGGAIVNASRSVLYAAPQAGDTWRSAVGRAARAFAADIRQAVGL